MKSAFFWTLTSVKSLKSPNVETSNDIIGGNGRKMQNVDADVLKQAMISLQEMEENCRMLMLMF